MVFMTDMPSATYDRIVNQELPEFGETKCVAGPPISDRRVAIGSVARYHYAFMGATPPTDQAPVAKDLAQRLKEDDVSGVILAGV